MILNPIVPRLRNEFNVDFKKNDLKTDIEQILNANTIVAGRGSFVPQILSLSLGQKKAYYFERNKIYRHDVEDGIMTHKTKPVKVEGYIQEWNNTPEQHQIMINFDLSKACNMNDVRHMITF